MAKQLFAPKDDRSVAARISVHEMREGEVRWSPAGGGPLRTTPRPYFDEVYSALSDEEIQTSDANFVQGRFEIEDLGEVEGFTNGETWNGWEKPWFTKEVMLREVSPLQEPHTLHWSVDLQNFVLVQCENEDVREAFNPGAHLDVLREKGEVEITEGEWLQATVAQKRTIAVDGAEIEVFLVDYGFCWDRIDTPETMAGPSV